MGYRAIVIVESENGVAAAAMYLHWAGNQSLAIVGEAAELMKGREGDESYAAARLIGVAHNHIEGNLSLGLLELPEGYQPGGEIDREYSHGDAGVIVWDCSSGTVRAVHGYMAQRLRADPEAAQGAPLPLAEALELDKRERERQQAEYEARRKARANA